jgi:predicted RecA/RadA family phage recombinase
MVDYTPSSAVTGGTVVVVGDLPLVAHRDIAADEQGALAAGGGVYEMTAGEAIAAGKKVWWNDSTNKVVETSTSNKVFGYLEADSSAAADGDTVRVIHMPEAA